MATAETPGGGPRGTRRVQLRKRLLGRLGPVGRGRSHHPHRDGDRQAATGAEQDTVVDWDLPSRAHGWLCPPVPLGPVLQASGTWSPRLQDQLRAPLIPAALPLLGPPVIQSHLPVGRPSACFSPSQLLGAGGCCPSEPWRCPPGGCMRRLLHPHLNQPSVFPKGDETPNPSSQPHPPTPQAGLSKAPCNFTL